jgi:hypothetical protein
MELEPMQIKQTANIIGSAGEIQKMNLFYQKYVNLLNDEAKAIEKEIQKKAKAKTIRLGLFFPNIRIKSVMSESEIIALQKRLLDIDIEIVQKEKYKNMWTKRSSDYEMRRDEILKEMNYNFTTIEQEAKKIAENNTFLKNHMEGFNKNYNSYNYSGEYKDSMQGKLEYYLFLKYNVAKEYKKNRKRFTIKSEDTNE